MPHNSTVSIIIIFLNAKDFLQEAIESVLAQTYNQWELLLVDDGSTDGSSEVARSFVNSDSSKIRYLKHDRHQNLGMSASRNLGIRNAKGDYIAFLDADDYWLPERLKTHVRILDTLPDVGMLYGSAKYWFSWTGRPEDKERDFIPEFKIHGPTRFELPTLLTLMLEGKAEVPCTCSILVRREIAQNVGGFDESFRGMYEDQAFYAKICLFTAVLATGDCLAWYRQHPTSNYSTAIHTGQVNALHLYFLKWLKAYCADREVLNKGVLQAIHRQLWLYDNRACGIPPGFPLIPLRWVKKWILRLEEYVLPPAVRNWLWTPRW